MSKKVTKGIHVKCLQCKRQVSAKCGLTGRKASSCPHPDKHRYNVVVVVPNSGGVRKSKILAARTYPVAIIEAQEFRKELSSNGWQPVKKRKEAVYLFEFMAEYLNELEGNTHEFKVRHRSSDHISDVTRVFKEFREAVRSGGFVFEIIKPQDVSDSHLALFHDAMKEKGISQAYFNRKIVLLRGLYNWLHRSRGIVISNPFNRIQTKKTLKKDIRLITREQFSKVIAVTTEENGYDTHMSNMYRSWLVTSFYLGLFTGVRREELLTLRFSNIVQINGVSMFQISNLKVNRIMSGSDEGRSKYIPITSEIQQFLNNHCDFEENKNSDKLIIPRDETGSLYHAKNLMSRAFSHFSRVAGYDLKFGVLRKTYLSKLFQIAGPNAKLFSGSSSEEVLRNHYLSESYAISKLEDFKILE
jgi:integrase